MQTMPLIEAKSATVSTHITQVGELDDGGSARGVYVSGSYAYVGDY